MWNKPPEERKHIFAMHGVADGETNAIADRNLMDRRLFEAHLASRGDSYGPLAAARVGECDALTIDDATVASAEAARIARKHGHKVWLFVNPHNVVMRETYFFHDLDILFDRTTVEQITVAGRSVSLRMRTEKIAARRELRVQLALQSSDAMRAHVLADLASQLKVEDRQIPNHLRTLTLDELHCLVQAGVEIGNHGWSHVEFGALAPSAMNANLLRGAEWIWRNFGYRPLPFAVPFGQTLPWQNQPGAGHDVWLLATHQLRVGRIGKHVYNRKDLCL